MTKWIVRIVRLSNGISHARGFATRKHALAHAEYWNKKAGLYYATVRRAKEMR